MRPIDADKVMEVHCKRCSVETQVGCKGDPICASMMDIVEAPTLNVVEVVRCGECEHWKPTKDDLGDCTNERFHLDGHSYPTMKSDDFCSLGGRRSQK